MISLNSNGKNGSEFQFHALTLQPTTKSKSLEDMHTCHPHLEKKFSFGFVRWMEKAERYAALGSLDHSLSILVAVLSFLWINFW